MKQIAIYALILAGALAPRAAAADRAPAAETTAPTTRPADSVPSAMRTLWSSSIRALSPSGAPQGPRGGDESLTNLIRQLEAMSAVGGGPEAAGATTRPSGGRPEPASQPATRPATRPTTAPADRKAAEGAGQGAAPRAKEGGDGLSALAKLPPKAVADAAELADALFARGEADAAAVLYTLALRDAQEGTDRAWLLFQLGNCLRRSDAARAREMYQRVLVEFPESSWAMIAKVESDLLGWQLRAAPEQLLRSAAAAAPAPAATEPPPATNPKVP
jgi:tetratricopeptide (TPR) repeat protein